MPEARKQESWILKLLMNRKWSFLRHLVVLLPLASIFYPNPNYDAMEVNKNYEPVLKAVYTHGVLMFCLSVSIIYFNLWVLVPRLLFKNKYLPYAFAIVALGIIYYLGEYFHGNYIYRPFKGEIETARLNIRDFVDYVLLPMIFLGTTTGYKVFKKWILDTQRLNDLQRAQLEQELTHLKNQVNPHFLFNTLNNLNTLTKTDPEKASGIILGLSDVLRYQLYDSTKEKVPLHKDIEVLSEYLLLEKIRKEQFRYNVTVSGDIGGLLVPPLLFINFIENALKHGAETREPSFLEVEFRCKEKKQLIFKARNSKPAVAISKHAGGLGLKNIRRRLDLLYQNNYHLEIIDAPNLYTVTLTLPL